MDHSTILQVFETIGILVVFYGTLLYFHNSKNKEVKTSN
jgi:hypothetical protein